MTKQAIKWIGGMNGFLEAIDQRKLPLRLVKLKIRDTKSLVDAIKTLAVRGAPLIGVVGAYGLVLSIQKIDRESSLQDAFKLLEKEAQTIIQSRPTAVNLYWAVNRVLNKAKLFIRQKPQKSIEDLKKVILNEAQKIHREDIGMCRRIGIFGQNLIKNGESILTHCNAGFLATAGEGTALSVFYNAKRKGKKFCVFVDETRPLLQGSRLTAWELKQAGIDTTLICDNMAGTLMKSGKITMVLTGADRIAANGDSANKIGTYSVSVLAKEHKIPFYIAAPSSTFDLSIKNGSQIPIEQRTANEVAECFGKPIAPKGVKIYNPAFDITPAQNITAIITDTGIIRRPDVKIIARFFKQK